MKHAKIIFIVIVLIIFITTSTSSQIKQERGAYDGKLRSFIESLKQTMKTGNKNLGIPILDPYDVKYEEIELNTHNQRISGHVADLNVDGSSEYNINKASFKFFGPTISLNLTWPSIEANSSYKIYVEDTESRDISFFGDGDVKFIVTDFTISITAKFKINSEKLSLEKVDTAISLRAIDFAATGIYNNEEASSAISAMVNSALPGIIDAEQKIITQEMDSILKKLVNSYLYDVTLQDILDLLG